MSAEKIRLPSYSGISQENLKGPTPLASKWLCRHRWRATTFQVRELSGGLKRHECTRCGMVEMR